MKAIDVLPFLIIMGLLSMLFYFMTGKESWGGASTAYVVAAIYVIVMSLFDRRKHHVRPDSD